MSPKSLLVEQFSATFDKEGWFVPLTTALDGLSATDAAWRDSSANHSVWQIVNHIYFWNDRYFYRFKGTPRPSIEIDNNTTFEGENENWQADKDRLTSMMNEWRTLIQAADDSKFDEEFMEGRTETWASVLADINVHTAYHVGQILYVRKQMGKWIPA